MTIARITVPGLTAMAASVALLWGCLINEHRLVQHAAREQAEALHEIRVLREKQRAQPAADPLAKPPHRPRTAQG